MSQSSGIHFEISERKILLRVFDIISVMLVLYGIGELFDFDYFQITQEHWIWPAVLALYLVIFASIFERFFAIFAFWNLHLV